MISIIIAVYNGEKWLGNAIASALSQTVEPLEIIVVDDGSTDKSLEVAKKYPVRVLSQANKGLASARNTGLMNSLAVNGDYCWDGGRNHFILPLDADDILLPDAVKKLLEIINQNPYVDIIAPSFKEFGLSDREVILMPEPKLDDFKDGNKIGYCAAIRKAVLLEAGGYSAKMVEGYEDLHLWIDLLRRGSRIVTIPEVLWMYRTKEVSMYTKITPEIHKKLLEQINKDFTTNLNF